MSKPARNVAVELKVSAKLHNVVDFENSPVLEGGCAHWYAQGLSLVTTGDNTAIVAASNDSTAAVNVGAVLVYKSLTHSSPLTQIATKGHPAPGAENILYNAFGDVSVNPDGELGFVSSLTGTGSNGSKDTAFFDNLTGNGLDLIAKSRDSAASGSINVITRSLFNDPARAIFQATLSNSGLSTAITSSNNQIIFSDNGTVAKLFQSGDSISEFPIVLPATLPGAHWL